MEHNLSYDRSHLRPRAVHLGVGAFHRAHQQGYYDDLARLNQSQNNDWGVVGINLTPPDLSATHTAQNGFYSVLTEDGDGADCRRIGTLLKLHDATSAASVSWDDIEFVTLTITEKGYCHHSGSMDLDVDKVAQDLASPQTPQTAIGYLAWMLERRRQAAGGPITLASCDNVADNGLLLASVLRDYVARAFPALSGWLDANVTFPTSMVDRIVPAMSSASQARLEAACGYHDGLGVVAEPFRQWVIEDRFASARPAFEKVGVQIVDTLAPYEHMKHRLLNGLQSSYAELGRLCGHEGSHGAATDPDLESWAGVFLASQAATLDCPQGENLSDYGQTSLKRLQNPTIHHPLNQIASDASFKLPQRIGAPAAERIAQGMSAEPQAMVLAGWAFQAGETHPDSGGVITMDPLGATIAALRNRHAGSATDLAQAILALSIWPERLREDADFATCVADWIKAFAGEPAEACRAKIGAFSREMINA
ncbi:mannitol dehydrogenase family protein [Pacificibacter marinus]|uniref:Polyol:NADP oxidoreductase n=1 Tax=Pacificibacter marinus TaxID=658057 RepID=A0A1Y5RXC2_9RHOB|nr:mannitol dehydrogenase family protein [Pacificibacter marinus]SEK34760.1 fructuronate reductase [Pacificibacter marinus]SLN27795.1 Polyol:NADP oxidoreductase [Pacificibacter marinus]